MVGAAKGNGELVADPATQRARLGKSQVVGIRWPAPAHQAWLLQVRTIAVAARFVQREDAFIDMPGDGIVHTLFRPRAYERGSVVILGGRRSRRCWASGTSLPTGSSPGWKIRSRPAALHWPRAKAGYLAKPVDGWQAPPTLPQSLRRHC
jgi:hypothetical protein